MAIFNSYVKLPEGMNIVDITEFKFNILDITVDMNSESNIVDIRITILVYWS